MQCEKYGDSYGRIEGRIEDPGGDRNSMGRPTEATILNLWGSQRLNHQQRTEAGPRSPCTYVADVHAALSSCGS